MSPRHVRTCIMRVPLPHVESQQKWSKLSVILCSLALT